MSQLIKSAADMPSAASRFPRKPSRKALIFFLEGLMSSFPLGYLRTFCSEEIKTLLHNTTNERGRNAGLPIGWKRKRLFEATPTEITPLSTSADGFVLVVSSSSTRYEFRLPRQDHEPQRFNDRSLGFGARLPCRCICLQEL